MHPQNSIFWIKSCNSFKKLLIYWHCYSKVKDAMWPTFLFLLKTITSYPTTKLNHKIQILGALYTMVYSLAKTLLVHMLVFFEHQDQPSHITSSQSTLMNFHFWIILVVFTHMLNFHLLGQFSNTVWVKLHRIFVGHFHLF